MQYRREIDGLRAIAVLPVIFFHAGFEIFRGGFVGVDIFFVISGYLITSLIYQDLKAGVFSFTTFYERRARRILPALYFVLLVSVPFAWSWLQPADLKSYFESLAAVSVFSSNILFWTESGYFDTAAELKPLLHTWSLAVEEQYYLIIPVLICFSWRNKKSLYVVFSIIFLISLAASEWASVHNTSAGFFLLPTRAWELLLGAFCALYLSSTGSKPFSNALMQVGSAVGLFLIFLSIFTFSKNTPFPGVYALIPTIGTAMIILFAQPSTVVGKVLSLKYFVGVGLISYSAYLWHQPIFSFARHRSLDEPASQVFMVLALMSVVLAYFSWRYVEGFFRRKSVVSKSGIYVFSFAGLIGVFSIGYYGQLNIGRETAPELAWLAGSDVPKKLGGVVVDGVDCSGRDPEKACQLSSGSYDKTLVVIGDSHARGFTQSVDSSLEAYRIRLIDLTSSGCPLLPGLSVYSNGAVFNHCDGDYQDKRLSYLKNLAPSTIVLMSRFPSYIRGEGFDNTVGGKEIGLSYYASKFQGTTLDQRVDEVRSSFFRAVESLVSMGHRVVVVGPVPPTGWDPIARLYRIERMGLAPSYEKRNALMKVPYKAVQRWDKPARDIIGDAVKKYPGVIFVDPNELFCANDYCSSITQDSILYADSNHLSLLGNGILFRALMGEISK